MAERFKILQALDPAQFATDNSSVQIVAARVLEDIQDNSYYLQVKFSNSGNQILSSLDISVQSNNTKVALWHYADLNLKQGDSTGSKPPSSCLTARYRSSSMSSSPSPKT